jgi:hypothetical protein
MKDLASKINPVRATCARGVCGGQHRPGVADHRSHAGRRLRVADVAIIATGALPDADATFTVLVEHGDAANL